MGVKGLDVGIDVIVVGLDVGVDVIGLPVGGVEGGSVIGEAVGDDVTVGLPVG